MRPLRSSNILKPRCICGKFVSRFRKQALYPVDQIDRIAAFDLLRMAFLDQKGNREVAAYFVYQVHNPFTFCTRFRRLAVRFGRNCVSG